MNIKTNTNILYIPGWLDTGERLGFQNSLDVWTKNIDFKKRLNSDIVIAHSLGSLVALQNWELNKNFRIILINPVTSKKDIIKRWFQFSATEGVPTSLKKSIKIGNIIPSILKTLLLLNISALDIISTIPKDNLAIVYGEYDTHLCDIELINKIKEKGFRAERIKGSGHNYDENIERAVFNLIVNLVKV